MSIVIDATVDRSTAIAATGMSEDLFAILVCPVDKRDLRLVEQALVCVECERTFQINDGIPDMLVEEQASE